MTVVLGVDGGGSKTEAVVVDVDGERSGTGRAAGSNWETAGLAGAVAQIVAAADEALAACGCTRGEIGAAVFGLAGIDWPGDVAPMTGALRAAGLGGRIAVVNDARIALRAGRPDDVGIVSNVGTGTVTAGRSPDGRWVRTMAVGWGEPSGASSLVRDALHAVAAEHHGVGPATALTPAFLAATVSAGVSELFEAVSRGRWRPHPGLAPLVDDAAADGDDVAISLLTESGRRHGAMVVGVARRLGLADHDVRVACTGSRHRFAPTVFRAAFDDAIRQEYAGASIERTTTSPVQGAIDLAIDLDRGVWGP